jgi:hypothetical protein
MGCYEDGKRSKDEELSILARALLMQGSIPGQRPGSFWVQLPYERCWEPMILAPLTAMHWDEAKM